MHKNAPSHLRLFQHGMLLKFSYQMMMRDLSIHINAKSPFKVACYFICSSSSVILMGFTTKMQRGVSQRWWMVLCGHLFSIVAMLQVLCLKDEGCKQTAPKCGFKSHCEYFANSVVTFARLCEITSWELSLWECAGVLHLVDLLLPRWECSYENLYLCYKVCFSS